MIGFRSQSSRSIICAGPRPWKRRIPSSHAPPSFPYPQDKKEIRPGKPFSFVSAQRPTTTKDSPFSAFFSDSRTAYTQCFPARNWVTPEPSWKAACFRLLVIFFQFCMIYIFSPAQYVPEDCCRHIKRQAESFWQALPAITWPPLPNSRPRK